MAVPTHEDLLNPLLRVMKSAERPITIDEQEAAIAQDLNLSAADRAHIHDGNRTELGYQLAWARNYLKRLGLIENIERGVWSVTTKGMQTFAVDRGILKELGGMEFADEDVEKIEGIDNTTFENLGEYPIDSVLVRQEVRTVFEIVRRIRDNKFILDPDFQREFIWGIDKQSKLIESTLMRIPLPVFYLAEREDAKTVVVDGLQRLTTFHRFLKNDFALRGLQLGKELNGKKFSELSPKLQNRIEDTQLILYLIDYKVPEQAKLDIFERVNGGVPLTRQQMRNCVYSGPATLWLRQEAQTREFMNATDHSLDWRAMRDRECINRFCAFDQLGVIDYRGDMDAYLARALQLMNKMSPERLSELSIKFRRSMHNNYHVFGRHSFRKHYGPNSRRSVINVALFDVFSVLLGRYPEDVISARKPAIQQAFYRLINNGVFLDAISFSTNATRKVNERFSLAVTVINSVIQNVEQSST